MVDSANKIRFVLPQNLLARAGKLHVTVKNSAPLATVEWGGISNTAHILVPFALSLYLIRPMDWQILRRMQKHRAPGFDYRSIETTSRYPKSSSVSPRRCP
jgi:hypothetical protein